MDDLLNRLRSGCETMDVVELNGVLHDQRCIDAAEEIELLQYAVSLFANHMKWDADRMSVELTGFPGSGHKLPEKINSAISRALKK